MTLLCAYYIDTCILIKYSDVIIRYYSEINQNIIINGLTVVVVSDNILDSRITHENSKIVAKINVLAFKNSVVDYTYFG